MKEATKVNDTKWWKILDICKYAFFIYIRFTIKKNYGMTFGAFDMKVEVMESE